MYNALCMNNAITITHVIKHHRSIHLLTQKYFLYVLQHLIMLIMQATMYMIAPFEGISRCHRPFSYTVAIYMKHWLFYFFANRFNHKAGLRTTTFPTKILWHAVRWLLGWCARTLLFQSNIDDVYKKTRIVKYLIKCFLEWRPYVMG